MFAFSHFFQIKTEYVKRKGIIIVDGQESEAVSALGDGSTLDVEGKLYLGGLPLDYVPKNLGNVRRFGVMGCLWHFAKLEWVHYIKPIYFSILSLAGKTVVLRERNNNESNDPLPDKSFQLSVAQQLQLEFVSLCLVMALNRCFSYQSHC